MFKQIKDVGFEKLIPDDDDLIPFQGSDGITGRIRRANLLSGLPTTTPSASTLVSTKTIFLAHLDTDIVDTKGHSLTSFGTPLLSSTQKVLGSKSLFFPGDSYLSSEASNFALNGDFSIECFVWIPSNYSSNDKYAAFVSVEQGSNGIILAKWRSGIKNNFYGQIYVGSTAFTVDTTTIPKLNDWNHIALVRQGFSLQIYLNGIPSNAIPITSSLNITGNYRLFLGTSLSSKGASLPDLLGGYLSEVRIQSSSFPIPSQPYT